MKKLLAFFSLIACFLLFVIPVYYDVNKWLTALGGINLLMMVKIAEVTMRG